MTLFIEVWVGRATLKFELVLSSEAQSRIGTDGTGNGGDGVQEATSQKFLLVTMEEPKSLHSLLVTHMSLKVESEHRMEPPTQAPYVAQGLVDTWMGWRRQSGGERGGEWGGRQGKRKKPASSCCSTEGTQSANPGMSFRHTHFFPQKIQFPLTFEDT